MRILYITSARLPTPKAHGYQIVKTCEALAKRHRVLLIAPTKNHAGIHEHYAAEASFGIESRFHVDSDFLRKHFNRLWFTTHLGTFACSAGMWALVNRSRFNLVYSRDPMSLYVLSRARRLLRLPLVYESHLFPEAGHDFQLALAKRLDGLVVVTNHLKSRFVDSGVDAHKILVEPDAVDLTQFDVPVSKEEARRKLGLPEDVVAATFAGRFHTMGMEKGIPEIIDGARHLVEEFPRLRFYFVGGPLNREDRYRARIEARALPQERFSFVARQPIATLSLWLKASDMLLMPHPRNTFYSFYVSPLKMFEYMAARRPIVGSRLPAIQEVLTDGEDALLAEPGDPESLAAAIRALIRDRGLGETLADRAFHGVARHTWDERANRLTEFASTLVGSTGEDGGGSGPPT